MGKSTKYFAKFNAKRPKGNYSACYPASRHKEGVLLYSYGICMRLTLIIAKIKWETKVHKQKLCNFGVIITN